MQIVNIWVFLYLSSHYNAYLDKLQSFFSLSLLWKPFQLILFFIQTCNLSEFLNTISIIFSFFIQNK